MLNRRIKIFISSIRDHLDDVGKILDDIEINMEELEDEPTEDQEEEAVNVTWATADEEPRESIYMKDLRELTELKGLTIIGEIKTVFDLKSYIHPKTQQPGIIYRFVISDKTGDMTVISFDDMATELKQYTIGQILKITNAWKMEVNKQNVIELHVGNFAKIEVVE